MAVEVPAPGEWICKQVYAVAQALDYDPEATFSGAFKRVVGRTPTAWRKQRRRSPSLESAWLPAHSIE